jgi:hypothetical protein
MVVNHSEFSLYSVMRKICFMFSNRFNVNNDAKWEMP